ncbi:MAG: sn-glycerol-3-phosphate ABC transporter permease UgpE [Casimicrobiaceae bacterium]|nr:sn-glycerol-3-phosphate ABC transporter permease UgpE [Casimicrobiaceae bacterium]MCX8097641.1 sn-glycerol-3-phosphate ABC transporter permease UgpE [Casimicrobiaceae bacterium]MDW8311937.1 sn-glycerol-3-phosphate ABC transporter permease UgpE [Burkholderiales bacterium]
MSVHQHYAPLEVRTRWVAHTILMLGVFVTLFPVWVTFVASTLTPREIAQVPMQLWPGDELIKNYTQALTQGSRGTYLSPPASTLLFNSLIVALVVTFGKIAVSLLSAFAIVFFKFPGRMFFFWMIFVTLMLPVEVRIVPTYQVVTDLGLINSYTGLTLPLIASATATLLFRQFFLTIPDELVEAAKIDGAGPMRFFWDVVVPLSRTNIAALFVILFIYGWNQYLWPLLITTSNQLDVIVVAIKKMIGTGAEPTDWHIVMATTMLALLPPTLVIVLMQKSFVKGLTETEK